MSKNDLLELVFDNPSGAPFELNIEAISQLVMHLDQIAQRACSAIAGGHFRARPLRLGDVQHGSLRFRLNLEVVSTREPNLERNGPEHPKDMLTYLSELGGVIALFLLLSGSVDSSAKRAIESSGLEKIEPIAQEMVDGSIHDPMLPGMQPLLKAAMKINSEVVIVRYREVDAVLIGPGGLLTDRLSIRSKRPLEIGDQAAPSIEQGNFALIEPKNVVVTISGQRVNAYIGELRVMHPAEGVQRFKVLAIWRSPTDPAASGETGVRYHSVDPDDVLVTDPTQFLNLDGVIDVQKAQTWM